MDFGLTVAVPFPLDLGELARRTEEAGFESLWFPEHTHIPVPSVRSGLGLYRPGFEKFYFYDPFQACLAAALSTTRLRVGTGISLVVERDPIISAKEVATLDLLSGGRFLFGIGAGWNAYEMADHGTDFKSRFSLMRDRIQAMKTIWANEVAEYHGRFVDFGPMYAAPKPSSAPHPPIYIGGNGPQALRAIVEYGDGWLPYGTISGVSARLNGRIRDLRGQLEAAGRKPDDVNVTLFGCPPEPAPLATATAADINRVILTLYAESEDEIWQSITRFGTVISSYAEA